MVKIPNKEETFRNRHQHYYEHGVNTLQASNDLYEDWAKTYNEEVSSVNYTGPKLASDYLHKHAKNLGLKSDCRILDVAAGTGLCAIELASLGYTNIDGSDPSEPMLEEAKKINAYKNYLCIPTGNGHKMPIEDNTYDVSLVVGGLPHIKEDGFEDMLRVTRPGGLFVCGGRTNYHTTDALWLNAALKRLKAEGRIETLEEATPKQQYLKEQQGLILCYRVLK